MNNRLFPQNPTAIAPSSPNTRSPKLHIKQRSPHITTNPIAYFPQQTAIAPHHHKPDRLFPQIKQRSPLSELFIIVVSGLSGVKELSNGEIKLAII
ncbi:hypothetical protein PseudUWO311_12705 [Pseudanabaena sp. UWO311]|uniref:hypothetical protein n=1 Tax=Pseudanabaena sp. UWO311 TaxID=2487337 RepID=UPI00115B8DC7|nr:hypothetical protein [Pseudanabaena sp. UWO311]TYQ26380.1 hypothetical protein PseudUWO311_12705 [Pseudanabaena sp. UWO311]